MTRVFSAVDIEDQKLLDRLEDIQDTLDLDFNAVGRQKMHITLEFFKDIDSREIRKIKESMDKIELDSFKADIKGLGVFPSDDYIRVVWAGVEADKFLELYNQASDHPVESDNNHDFQPHITLLRVRSPSKEQKKKLKRTIREFKDYEFGKINVDELKLFESHIGGKNKYRQIHNKKLRKEDSSIRYRFFYQLLD